VLAPATDLVGAAKLAERVGGSLGDAALRVGYDAVTNLKYAPMDPVELLARRARRCATAAPIPPAPGCAASTTRGAAGPEPERPREPPAASRWTRGEAFL